MTKPIPKSLHTVRVVAVLANALRWNYPSADALQLAQIALNSLGYADAPDTYGIAQAAAKTIAKELAK